LLSPDVFFDRKEISETRTSQIIPHLTLLGSEKYNCIARLLHFSKQHVNSCRVVCTPIKGREGCLSWCRHCRSIIILKE
jgi:hypothetical protein